jgi:soluble lytic murein transglycosylase-like protein
MRRASAGWVVAAMMVVAACMLGRRERFGGAAGYDTTSSAWAAPARRATPLLALIRDRPELEDLTLYLLARDAARSGDVATATAHVTALGERHPDSIWLGGARLLVGQLHRQTGDLDGAREWLESARRSLEGDRERASVCTLALGEIAHLRGDDVSALELARAVRGAHPHGIVVRRAQRLTARIRRVHPELFADATSHLAEARLLLDEGDARAAALEAEATLATGPSADERAAALFVRGRAQHVLGEQSNAEATCLEVARTSDALGPKALATAARWRWNGDDDAGALRLYRQLTGRFPASNEAVEAGYAIGRIQQEAGRYDEAFDAFDRLAREQPRATVAPEARWRAGWVRYLAGDLGAAAQYFGGIVADGPPSIHPAAAYWEARIRGMLRDPDADAELAGVVTDYPASYYAALAAERLGRPSPEPRDPIVAPPTPPFPDDLAGAHAERARALAALGLPALARRELDAIGDDEAPRLAVAQAYTAVGALSGAILSAQGAGATDERTRRFLYPLGFWPIVESEARARGLDPLLVVSLIRQESLFVPDATSPADAHGLMQLLPRTARDVAASAGLTPAEAKGLDVPATNVRLGTTLLRRLLDRYDGSRVKALAAYNGGEEAVAKWEHRYGARPDDEFVELISFRETRDYVKLVLQNLQIYRQLYAASPAATSFGSPPKAPFDMMTTTSPGALVATR